MSTKNILRLCLFALVIIVPALAQTGTPAAILLSCRGDVTVIKDGGGSIKGSYGLALDAGDEVRTGVNSEAEIHFENGTWIQVGASSSMKVKGSRAKEPAPGESLGEKSFQVVQNFLKLRDSEGTSSLAALRSAGKNVELRLESPGQTKIRGHRPVFRWKSSDPSTDLLLILYNEEGIHWQHRVKDVKSLSYPSDAPPLVPGVTYSWTLETTDPLRFPPLRSRAAFFEILSAEEEECFVSDFVNRNLGTRHKLTDLGTPGVTR